MFKLKNKKSLLLMALILMAMMVFTACKSEVGLSEVSDAEESAQEATWTIKIETPDGKDVDFTDLDLKEIGTDKINATTKRKDGTEEENEWTGVQLNKILKFAGIEEYNTVDVEASDGFNVQYTKEIAGSDKTILAVKIDGENLKEGSGPAQMVVEGERANLWIKSVAKIKVNK